MTPEELDAMLVNKIETTVMGMLGTIIEHLEAKNNETMEGYAAAVMAGKVTAKFDEKMSRAYDTLIEMEYWELVKRRDIDVLPEATTPPAPHDDVMAGEPMGAEDYHPDGLPDVRPDLPPPPPPPPARKLVAVQLDADDNEVT